MNAHYDDWATVQMSLTLPYELHGKLNEMSSVTGVPKSGLIQYFLEHSDFVQILEAIHDMAQDGERFPQMPRATRSTPRNQPSVDAYLGALTLSRRKSRKLRDIDQALIDASNSDSPVDVYQGGNYV